MNDSSHGPSAFVLPLSSSTDNIKHEKVSTVSTDIKESASSVDEPVILLSTEELKDASVLVILLLS